MGAAHMTADSNDQALARAQVSQPIGVHGRPPEALPVGPADSSLPSPEDPIVLSIARQAHVSIAVAQRRALVERKSANFAYEMQTHFANRFGGSYTTADSMIIVMVIAPSSRDRQYVADEAWRWSLQNAVQVDDAAHNVSELNSLTDAVAKFMTDRNIALRYSIIPNMQAQTITVAMNVGAEQSAIAHALREAFTSQVIVELVPTK
jgi:hypothetical protein